MIRPARTVWRRSEDLAGLKERSDAMTATWAASGTSWRVRVTSRKSLDRARAIWTSANAMANLAKRRAVLIGRISRSWSMFWSKAKVAKKP